MDETEGPIISKLISKRSLRTHPGLVYFRAVWQLPEQDYNEFGHTKVWVILREEINEVDWDNDRGGTKRKYLRIASNLEELPTVASLLVGAASDLEVCKTVECVEEYNHRKEEYLEYADDLKGDAAHVGSLLRAALKHGILLGDVHEGNVGFRRHSLKEYGVKGHRKMVVMDVGDEGQPIMVDGTYPRVKVVANPDWLSYWASKIPVL